MRRPGDDVDLKALEKVLPGVSAKVEFVTAPLIDISASQIRQRVAGGRPFRYFVPPPVYELIVKHGLYKGGERQDG
jgi:nicotinate-nucleotide adenylyltransferase